MIAHVAQSPMTLVREMRMVAAAGRELFQSIPVDDRRCTFSTTRDQATIGAPVKAIVSNDA